LEEPSWSGEGLVGLEGTVGKYELVGLPPACPRGERGEYNGDRAATLGGDVNSGVMMGEGEEFLLALGLGRRSVNAARDVDGLRWRMPTVYESERVCTTRMLSRGVR